jgi:hypothetical protein
MKRMTLTAICLGIALAGSLMAAPFWVSKPYTQWTEKEVEKLLGNSPWVQSAAIEMDFSAMRRGPGGASAGGPGGPGAGGPGMGGPGGPGMGGFEPPSAYIMWQSATPIRQAMARAAALRQSPAAADLEAQLSTEPTHHILAVMGLRTGPGGMGPGGMRRPEGASAEGGARQISPEQQAEMRERMQAQLQESAELIVDKDNLKPEKVETVISGSERIILFYFPNDADLSAKTKNVQFRAQMGPMKISAKFKAKDMFE